MPTVDPWVYLGFFRNLVNFKRELYPSTYYGSRLSWIIPGFIIHHLFSALVAEFVLHLLVYFTAVFCLYYTLSTTIERRPALMGALAFGLYPYVWRAVGTDYVDGVGIAYYLLTTALLTKASFAKRPAAFLVAAGAAYALLFYSNITWTVFAPILALHYLWLRKAPGLYRPWNSLFWACVWTVAGFAAVTMVLGLINYRLDGDFWFYRPSIQYAINNVAQRSPWYQGIRVAGRLVPWLWLPFLILIIGFLTYGARSLTGKIRASDAGLLYLLELAIGLGFFGYMQSRGAAPLGIYFYASFLIPTIFLAATPLAWGAARQLNSKSFVIILLVALAALILPWLVPGSAFLRAIRAEPLAAGILVGALLCGAVVTRKWAGSLCFAITSFGLLYISVIPDAPEDRSDSQLRYERIISARQKIEPVRDSRKIRWWYNEKDPNANDFMSLSSTYLWGYTLVSLNFPELPAQTGFSTPTLLAIASSRSDLKDAAMRNLEGVLTARHLAASWKRIDKVSGAPTPYYVGLAMIEEDPHSARHALSVSYDSRKQTANLNLAPEHARSALPNSAWKLASYPGREGSLSLKSDGVDVTTPSLVQAYATIYPTLRAPIDGTYGFEIEFKPIDGHLTWGMLAGDESHWITSTTEVHPAGASRVMRFDINLKEGEEFHLLTSNLQSSNRSSHYIIQQARAFLVAND